MCAQGARQARSYLMRSGRRLLEAFVSFSCFEQIQVVNEPLRLSREPNSIFSLSTLARSTRKRWSVSGRNQHVVDITRQELCVISEVDHQVSPVPVNTTVCLYKTPQAFFYVVFISHNPHRYM